MDDVAGRYRIGIDIGGTFTDLALEDGDTGEARFGKTLTTPADPSLGVETVLSQALGEAGLAAHDVSEIVHGTTLVTNALIERKGAPTALLATAGFRDVIEIRRENRFELYDLQVENPVPLVPRHLRVDIPQRTLADGSALQPLDEAVVEEVTRRLVGQGIEAIAISFLHSYADPSDERRAREIVHRIAPHVRVSISSEVVPEWREYERTTTTVANVYVQRLADDYLARLRARLERLGFEGRLHVMLSSGGIAQPETAATFPIRMLESGPAGGALAAARCGARYGHPSLLSFDMGGTTAKLCVVSGGEPSVTHGHEVDRVYRFKRGSGLPVKTPVIEMIEIGAGGGSIARIDALGLLAVGPESAGADPGPACYGRGGLRATVTDADLLLGYLGADSFLGGDLRLDAEAAREAVETMARALGLTPVEAAWGIHAVVDESMANAARVHAIERGLDASGLPLFAFGGAGPVHACHVARALRSPCVIVPPGAGVLSASGFLEAPLAFDFVRSYRGALAELDWTRVRELLGEMEQQGAEILAHAGVPPGQVLHRRSVEARYVGQGYEIPVELPAGPLDESAVGPIESAFVAAYRSHYGRAGPAVPVEIVTWRVVSSAERAPREAAPEHAGDGEPVRTSRVAYFPEAGGFVETPVIARSGLGPGTVGEGPAIVEERESTLVVPPGARWSVGGHGEITVVLES